MTSGGHTLEPARELTFEMMNLPRSAKEAKGLGVVLYFTGKPCKHGHICPRRSYSKDCVECAKRWSSSYKKSNPEKINVAKRAWWRANSEKLLEISRLAYRKNPEAFKKRVKKYRAENWPKISERLKKARLKDLAKSRSESSVAAQKRRARAAKAEGAFTAKDIYNIRKLQKDKCAFCRCKLHGRGQIDHRVALSRGGTNFPRNLQLVCKSCNPRKNNLDEIVFARTRGLLL